LQFFTVFVKGKKLCVPTNFQLKMLFGAKEVSISGRVSSTQPNVNFVLWAGM
jgi:hypothetical protein